MPTAFDTLGLSESLLTVIQELGFESATAVQEACIPPLLEGRDVIGQSKTGSGKTVAFSLPILERLDLGAARLQALILCPTRELCAQVAREVRKLGRRHQGLQVRTISGGEPMREQVSALRRGVHVVVGTPGRVLDHLRRGNLDLSEVRTVVLDEADRMLEMGFQEDVESVVKEAPQGRQIVLFSATFPERIEEMSGAHQRDPVRLTIENEEEVASIRQVILEAEGEDKLAALLWTLGNFEYETAIVFCNFKATVAELEKKLHLEGVSVDCIHGDLEQYDRDKVMTLLRGQSIRVLIATDVAARGIDVSELDLVVNYELPSQEEIYTHRIGRTGRAGAQGLAVSILDRRERSRMKALEESSGVSFEAAEWTNRPNGEVLRRPAKMQTIQIGGGRKDKVRPGDILGALTGEAGGLSADDIGKIEIRDKASFVAVKLELSAQAARSLSNGKIKGRRFRASIVR